MSTTQAETEPREHDEEEQLPRMSFGDHLEELRRRLLYSLIALGVCIVALIPFKEQVTEVYVAPYRSMWRKSFQDYVARVEEQHLGGKALAAATEAELARLHPLVREKIEFLRDYGAQILDGTFPLSEVHRIADVGGFRVPYTLIAIGGLEDFWTFMAASLLFSIMLASPVIVYQIWAFVAAGLYRRERMIFYKYIPFAAVLLIAGLSFGFFVVVPYGLYFLVGLMNWAQVQPMISVAQYFSLLFTLTVALGVVFQLPLIMLALTKIGVVTHEGWKQHWRYVVLVFFVVSAMLTPPDPFTQVMMATPLIVLYVVGLVLTARASKAGGPSLVRRES